MLSLPWWGLLPVHYYERLKMDLQLSTVRVQQAAAFVSGSIIGSNQLVDTFEVALLCWNAVQRLHFAIHEILEVGLS